MCYIRRKSSELWYQYESRRCIRFWEIYALLLLLYQWSLRAMLRYLSRNGAPGVGNLCSRQRSGCVSRLRPRRAYCSAAGSALQTQRSMLAVLAMNLFKESRWAPEAWHVPTCGVLSSILSKYNASRRPYISISDPSMCVFFNLNRYFLPVDIQHRRCPCRFFKTTEIQALWTQNYGTDILHLLCSKQSRFCDGMPSYWIRQARHTHYMKGRKQKKTKKNNRKKKLQKQNETKSWKETTIQSHTWYVLPGINRVRPRTQAGE